MPYTLTVRASGETLTKLSIDTEEKARDIAKKMFSKLKEESGDVEVSVSSPRKSTILVLRKRPYEHWISLITIARGLIEETHALVSHCELNASTDRISKSVENIIRKVGVLEKAFKRGYEQKLKESK